MSLPVYESLPYKATRVELRENGVVVVTLTRSKQRNTFTNDLLNEIVEMFDLFDRDDRVRVVVLTAEPNSPAFCAGADISGGWDGLWLPENEKEGKHAHRDTGGVASMAIFRCRKITISAVNGHAAGVGVTGLQLPFDFRFVWEGAKISMPFVRRGIVPEAVSSYILPKLVGHSRAISLLLSGSTLPATSHLLTPLWHAILPTREEVFPAAYAFAQELAQNTSQTSIAVTKALIWRNADSVEGQHLLDSRAMRELGGSGDAAEGARAFMERREVRMKDTLSKDLGNWVPWWNQVDIKHRKAKL
ncbi:peroxisomal enoyl-CoA-hydratase [Panus rudis PR-1116 ss-1]|nr:peroxisomal enoyl-CoA-hydratase [Panus rudis PR-1116 ss-1]